MIKPTVQDMTYEGRDAHEVIQTGNDAIGGAITLLNHYDHMYDSFSKKMGGDEIAHEYLAKLAQSISDFTLKETHAEGVILALILVLGGIGTASIHAAKQKFVANEAVKSAERGLN